MRVEVQYDAPVSAIVNTATGEVERIAVWCEGLALRDGESAVISVKDEQPLKSPARERAVEIAESAAWPAWDLD